MSDITIPNDVFTRIYWALPLFGKVNFVRACKLFYAIGRDGRDFEAVLRSRIGAAVDAIELVGGTLTGGIISDCLLAAPEVPPGCWYNANATLLIPRYKKQENGAHS